jgi:hypothetical protein
MVTLISPCERDTRAARLIHAVPGGRIWKQMSEAISNLRYRGGERIDRIIGLLSQVKRMIDGDEIPLTRIISKITLRLFI